jgi:hypothetical protein
MHWPQAMHHAKRMVLVDERFLENIWRKENSSWKRPTDQKAKASLHHSLQTDLLDSSLPDDIKAKSHQQHLNRFLHTSRELPVIQQDLISLEPKADDLLKLDIPEIKPIDVKKSKKKTTESPRRSKRGRRKSQKLDWEEWSQK